MGEGARRVGEGHCHLSWRFTSKWPVKVFDKPHDNLQDTLSWNLPSQARSIGSRIRGSEWLVLFKTAYLTVVLAAVVFWPGFDEERAAAVSAIWFDADGAALSEAGTGLDRHFVTWDEMHEARNAEHRTH